MLNQNTANVTMARNTIDIAIARARRERDAEVARLLGIALNSVRTVISRAMNRATAAMSAANIGTDFSKAEM